VEKLGAFWHRTTGMEIVLVRATNVYGPFARFDPATSNFIPALVRKSVDRQDPFEVWGSPDVTRDVIYAEDFAEAVVRLLENRGIVFDVFNVGSGQSVTVENIVELSLKQAKHTPSRLEWRPDRPATSRHRGYDCTKVRTAVDWSPGHSLEEGIAKTVRWWTENKDGWKR
jgi:GDP-L-fucose synthase